MVKKRFIWDLDGTLLKPDYTSEAEYFRKVLTPEEQELFIPRIGDLLSKYEQEFRRYNVNDLSIYLTHKSGVNITPMMIEGWRGIVSDYNSQEVEGVRDTLIHLKGLGHSLVVLTNWFESDQSIRLRRANLRNYFDAIYGGEDYLKPLKESYILAAGEFDPKDCVMVGDSLDNDVYGAYRAGMDAIYYNPNDKGGYNKHLVKSIRHMDRIREMYYED